MNERIIDLDDMDAYKSGLLHCLWLNELERVTRCSNCIHWDAGGRSLSGAHGCQKWLITTPPEFFCAGAEPCER